MGKNVVAKQPEECGWTTGRSIRRNQLELFPLQRVLLVLNAKRVLCVQNF